MIFVTVGTHEQPFDRLIKYIDELKCEKVILEDVIIQMGYSTFIPKYCTWSKLFSYDEMNEYVEEARIVITHGGPSSFLLALQKNKIPIVVPRRKEFDEHINNHQLEFCGHVEEKLKNIIVINQIEELHDKILQYDQICSKMLNTYRSNNEFFCNTLRKELEFI